ncbi:unnamed protein product, partial [Tetraodon nigroviridis]
MVCGGFTCSKNALCSLNVVYMLVGLLLIGVAAWGKGFGLVSSIHIIGGVIAVGVFLLLIAIVGLIGALHHHQVMLFFYMVILFIVFLFQFGVSCSCLAVNRGQQACKKQSHCYTCGDKMLTHATEALKILGGVGLFFSFTEEEYYGSEPRPRSLAFEDKEPRLQVGLDAVSLASSASSMRTPQCRICFQGPEQILPGKNKGQSRPPPPRVVLVYWVAPSRRRNHVTEEWQAISLTVIEKVQIAAIILGSLFLIASISWLIWSSLSPSAKWQRQDLLFQICYGMYGFMDIVCIGLIIHEGSSVYRIFKRWQAVNQQWKVLNYEKSKDLGDPVSSSSKAGARGARGAPHRLAGGSSGRPSRRLRTILNHHCGYTILHILSQLRPNDPRISAANREVVMRVTTV